MLSDDDYGQSLIIIALQMHPRHLRWLRIKSGPLKYIYPTWCLLFFTFAKKQKTIFFSCIFYNFYYGSFLRYFCVSCAYIHANPTENATLISNDLHFFLLARLEKAYFAQVNVDNLFH